ncbi:MAG: aminomethyl-transferring glycine dehydrogenase subunit GcvPB [Clostridiales bacterium]|nr:aminomethyl-transferring glycine dehydrogenase subunit GcvPB [Clostridiales bacterium]
MKLIFERGGEGRHSDLLPKNAFAPVQVEERFLREKAPALPEVNEVEIAQHYTELAKQAFGVSNGMYPLGSCTMKYNPKVNEEAASLRGFTDIHPLQPEGTMQGVAGMYKTLEKYLLEITGMDAVTFQPAAGAHGEFTGLQLIQAYHRSRGDEKRCKIIVPDTAHGTNPASCTMCGYQVVNIPSNEKGGMDLDLLREAAGEDTAGLMLTNPNTLGIFDENIEEITAIIHEAGGLCYYDGANLNAVIGIARPGDMGFDVMHTNLHKTFSTPHGGGGPGSGSVACKSFLAEDLPGRQVSGESGAYHFYHPAKSIGSVTAFDGNALVVLRALAYVLTLGREGIPQAAENAVLNANYMRAGLEDVLEVPYGGPCMHEFVASAKKIKKETGVAALDIAKGMIDCDMHPPTIYFPLIVDEALMYEPTETESKESIDRAVEAIRGICAKAYEDPEYLHGAPHHAPIGRPDEVTAARHPVVRYQAEEEEKE